MRSYVALPLTPSMVVRYAFHIPRIHCALTIARADGSPPGALLKDIDLVLSVLNDWEKAMPKARRRGSDEGNIL